MGSAAGYIEVCIDEDTIMVNSSANVDIEQQQNCQNDSGREEPTRQPWTFSRTFHTASAVIPLHTRKDNLSDPAVALRQRALECLLGLSPDHVLEWSGLLCFLHHLEHLFEQLLEPSFIPIWSLIDRDVPSSSVEGWHWCFAVIDAYKSSTSQDPSIESIYKRICRLRSPRNDASLERRRCIYEAIFAVLCWTSGTLTPLLGDRATQHLFKTTDPDASNGDDENLPLLAENCTRVYSANELRRPTSKMFRAYLLRSEDSGGHESARSNVQTAESGRSPDSIFEDMLHVSSLNYGSLCDIGGVRIKWVDVLTAHLSFNRVKRELSVYQYPSFCAAKILSQQKDDVLERITETILPPEYSFGLSEEPDSIHREILLSYRVLFGQTESSRKLMKRELSRFTLSSKTGVPRNKSYVSEGEKDRFLETLCTLPLYPGRRLWVFCFGRKASPRLAGRFFPISALSVDNELIESDTYSARDDFPVFGCRLLTLQRYNLRRQPSKILDLWRDRRNPLQWYTFWAVVFVGGCGLLLAALQLAVGVIQVVYAIKPSE